MENYIFTISQGEPFEFIVDLEGMEADSVDVSLYNKVTKQGVTITDITVTNDTATASFTAQNTLNVPIGMATIEVATKTNDEITAIFFKDDFSVIRMSNETIKQSNNS